MTLTKFQSPFFSTYYLTYQGIYSTRNEREACRNSTTWHSNHYTKIMIVHKESDGIIIVHDATSIYSHNSCTVLGSRCYLFYAKNERSTYE